jgi:hypothetical protein
MSGLKQLTFEFDKAIANELGANAPTVIIGTDEIWNNHVRNEKHEQSH